MEMPKRLSVGLILVSLVISVIEYSDGAPQVVQDEPNCVMMGTECDSILETNAQPFCGYYASIEVFIQFRDFCQFDYYNRCLELVPVLFPLPNEACAAAKGLQAYVAM